jgi:2-polyprenyl-3-methyl-5-hydroxy-6-metoxy-1,4-benzoquinol methylase
MSFKMIDISEYKQSVVNRFTRIINSAKKGTYDEQALPAYTNSNKLMNWLFWERVRVVINYLESVPNIGKVLDFGCGLGVMLPYLNQKACSIIAVDLEISMLERIGRSENWLNVVYATDLHDLIKLHQGTLDFILAMDVLEHIDNLEDTLSLFKILLKKNGKVIVSGPTENAWYKLGRVIAGYSGHYHKRNVYDILNGMQNMYKTKNIATLFSFIPLFVIAECCPNLLLDKCDQEMK